MPYRSLQTEKEEKLLKQRISLFSLTMHRNIALGKPVVCSLKCCWKQLHRILTRLMLFICSLCDRPRVIEALRGKSIVDIACGGSHSACITSSGELYTWGKGRYGRLGHGDSEDQVLPKLVEALRGQRVVDVACGSGDAQTLCLTDNDCVWSWGDGDYGKLGRGGSDGCKIPMKVEALIRAGVCKVECGSQFSVALTKSGAVYTW